MEGMVINNTMEVDMILNRIKSYAVTIVLSTCLMMTQESEACTVAPDEYMLNHEKMIQQSADIYLVKAISKKRENKIITTTFDVLDVVKGRDRKQITISFPDFEYEKNSSHRFMTDFSLHNDEKFWKSGVGRSQILTNCETVASFRLGYGYLLFPKFKSNAKGAEIINDTSDKWYQFVKESISADLK
ncbi:hypothetical protein [Pseudoalteromonas sp. Of7M-16]|uniref:hypothetical protein n=1 Tax=Pseudoalteromonas sp. Of7M-16 TaxID=2917756 RepID=UPI001EF709F8|nr:hypothetical protein [Pseudoalteromonas sp. Of7M-16]MCG7551498.1 hypothetical protein [Pseudoalteromonas sp. Of7M-16]